MTVKLFPASKMQVACFLSPVPENSQSMIVSMQTYIDRHLCMKHKCRCTVSDIYCRMVVYLSLNLKELDNGGSLKVVPWLSALEENFVRHMGF